MSLQQIVMDAPATASDGAALNVEGFGDKLVEFIRTGGTFDLEWSKDAINWNAIATGIVATGVASTEDATNIIPRAAKFLRVVNTMAGVAVFTFVGAFRGQR